MPDNNINKIKQLFDELLALQPSQRRAFIDEKCKDDPGLHAEVLSLLRSYESNNDFLEEPLTLTNEEEEHFDDPFIGKQIGNYVIDGIAGTGGMGIVYTGRRNDNEFYQKVAIKILKHGISSEYLLQRFQLERQTLANLQHQNIARLLDGGKTSDGLPYLVMEFVDGLPITEYCNLNKLNIYERLNLFREVCDAVHYAHQNLVVHRDIKPGNIIVTRQGVPKLLDFGIAKLLDAESEDKRDKQLTQTGIWHLTPEYASPEQIKGEKITTSSDVYSLGVLLYQLLTGQQPYRITSASPVAISKIITEEIILKPSDRVKKVIGSITSDDREKQTNVPMNPVKLSQRLRGDLDTIIMKAMHKEPSRRYTSVEQFSEDIRRHITGLPVIARKDTAGYRLSKFIRRHRTGFFLSILFSLFLLASIVVIIWQANIASQERDKAELEAKKSEKVNLFFQDMLAAADPQESGRDTKVYDVLQKAAKNIENEFKNQPEFEALIRNTIGKTFINLGEFSEAEGHLLTALSLNEKIYGKGSNEASVSLYNLGLLYHWLGDFKKADSLYSKSLYIYGKNQNVPARDYSNTLNDYAILLNDIGKPDSALLLYEEALDLLLRDFSKMDKDVASVMNNMAVAYAEKGLMDKAEEYYLEALRINLELLGEERTEVSSNYNNLAFIYESKNEIEKAREYFIKSLDLKKKIYGSNHSMVGLALLNLGGFEFKQNNFSLSENYIRGAIENFKISIDRDHVWIASSYYWSGKLFIVKGEYKSAENNLLKSYKMYRSVYPGEHSYLYASKGELGISLFYQKKLSEAENHLVLSYNWMKDKRGTDDENTKRFYEYLTKIYKITGKDSNIPGL